MALKGHTKIQLFNVETGVLENEVEDNNMVTNAVAKLLNPPIDFLMGVAGTNDIVNNVIPISTAAMGGVMVFSNRREENADLIMTDGNDAVGHAGDVYSGTNQYIGTLNTNESKRLTNGYRLVWDFGTDRANGEIACVCLTSRNGGNAGLNSTRDTDTDNFNKSNLYSNFYQQYLDLYNTNSLGSAQIEGIVDRSTFVAFSDTSPAFTLNYYHYLDPQKINLNWNDSTQPLSTAYKTIQVQPTYRGSTSWYPDSNGILRCIASYYRTQDDGNYELYFACNKIDLKTGELILDKKVTIDRDSLPDNFTVKKNLKSSNFWSWALMENYIIGMFYNTDGGDYRYTMALINYDGKYIKTIANWNSENPGYRSLYCQKYKAHYYSGNQWLTEDGEIVRLGFHQIASSYRAKQLYVYQDIFPYFVSHYYNYSGNQKVVLGKYMTYLATINNLATPVTKTNQQTMKITYDLVET